MLREELPTLTRQLSYTGSRLQRVRLLRALGYNKQFFLRKEYFWLTTMVKSAIITSTCYNEQIFLTLRVIFKQF